MLNWEATYRSWRRAFLLFCFALPLACLLPRARAEDGSAAWLRYAPVAHPEQYRRIPSLILQTDASPATKAAADELQRGLASLLGRPFTVVSGAPSSLRAGQQALVVAVRRPQGTGSIAAEGYSLRLGGTKAAGRLTLVGDSPAGALYGAFHLLEEVASSRPLRPVESSAPAAPVRWTDEWDNLDGTIERGFAGRSIFFDQGHVRQDLSRVGDYGRLLASVGINGCNVNNVNSDLDLLTSEHLREFARIAAAFRPWGVKLALSVDLTSPQTVGGLNTFDPLDPAVIQWWQGKADEIYTLMPDFGGFTVKADSEGRKGPSQYGRSPADAANVLARALAPHHGVVLYRGFVYNNHLDWRDPKADRARAGVDNFARYDGAFEPNVIVQIKEGPIDFQAREPVSPLFANLPRTNVAIELQTAQEYTGQQRHMVWLPSMWKWVLHTDLRVGNRPSPVRDIITGHRFATGPSQPRPGGFVSVTNVGLEANWLHHPMAMANLYGFGRLAWNPRQSLLSIADTWTRLTWGNDPVVDRTIDQMLLASWSVYEGYTGPHGMGTLTNITGPHFGPGIESAEHNGWGQWFRAEKDGIGMDRTAAGTGMAGQYPPALARRYGNLATCPEDLLLFFHHVSYDYRLRNGKTLAQDIYDTHYRAAQAAGEFPAAWEALEGKVDQERFAEVNGLLEYQAGHAIVWRDAVNRWFARTSGIADTAGRVDHDPNRIEAEDMERAGYAVAEATRWETVSGSRFVACRAREGCTLTTRLDRPAGTYDVAVQYFDTWRGVSQFALLVNGQEQAQWAADDTLPPAIFDPEADGETSTRVTVRHVALKPGDLLQIRGVPDLRPDLKLTKAPPLPPGAPVGHPRTPPDFREFAPVDYIELGPDGAVTPQ